MSKLFLSLLLVFLSLDCIFALPNGSTCPNDGQNISHTYPDPDHCSQYYECYNGILSHMTCQLDYLYDAERGWCNFPEAVYCGDRDCDGRNCNDDNNNDDFKCDPDNHVEHFFPDPNNCAKYYECWNGVATHRICNSISGQQLMYRPSNIQCDWADRVECGDRPVCDKNDENCHGGSTTTTPEPAKTTTQKPSSSTEKPPNPTTLCKNVKCKGDNEFYPEGDCKQCFCQCDHGIADEICCPLGLVFNSVSNRCDWPYNVVGC